MPFRSMATLSARVSSERSGPVTNGRRESLRNAYSVRRASRLPEKVLAARSAERASPGSNRSKWNRLKPDPPAPDSVVTWPPAHSASGPYSPLGSITITRWLWASQVSASVFNVTLLPDLGLPIRASEAPGALPPRSRSSTSGASGAIASPSGRRKA